MCAVAQCAQSELEISSSNCYYNFFGPTSNWHLAHKSICCHWRWLYFGCESLRLEIINSNNYHTRIYCDRGAHVTVSVLHKFGYVFLCVYKTTDKTFILGRQNEKLCCLIKQNSKINANTYARRPIENRIIHMSNLHHTHTYTQHLSCMTVGCMDCAISTENE